MPHTPRGQSLIRLLTTISLLAITLITAHRAPPTTNAAGPCECVIYILNRFNGGTPLSNPDGRYNYAYQLDRAGSDGKSWMEKIAGGTFRRTSAPTAGGVLVLQRGAAGASTIAGHIGVIDGVSDGGSVWIITMRSANWGGSQFTDSNCTNVSQVQLRIAKSETGVSYWSQSSSPNQPTAQPPPPPAPGACPPLALLTPANGQDMTDQTITFHWQHPGGDCSDRPIVLRVKTIPGMTDAGNTIFNVTLSSTSTSYAYTFGEEFRYRDLYWSVWRERSGTGPVQSSRFRIVAPTACPVIPVLDPMNDQELTAQTVTFRWFPVAGDCSDRPIVLRVKTIPGMTDAGNTIFNVTLSSTSTSYAYTFGEEFRNRDLYWSVWRERSGTGPGQSSRFRLVAPPAATVAPPTVTIAPPTATTAPPTATIAPPTATPAVGAAQITIAGTPLTGFVGQPITATVQLAGVSNLGAGELTLTVDPRIATITGIVPGVFAGSSGRSVLISGQQIAADGGSATIGVFTIGDAPAASGSGPFVQVGLMPRASGTTSIQLQAVQLSTVAGNALPVQISSGTLRVSACIGDLDDDGDVDILDVQRIAYHWGSRAGDGRYSQRFDGDNDGDVDILDVQRVAGRWGTVCRATATTRQQNNVALATATDMVAAESLLLVEVRLRDVRDLGGFALELGYDPQQLTFVRSEAGPLLGSTGRSVLALDPVLTEPGTLHVRAITLGHTPPGAQGEGVLARVWLRSLQPGPATVRVAGLELATITGDAMADPPQVETSIRSTGYRVTLPQLRS